jgi:hypothetical protein
VVDQVAVEGMLEGGEGAAKVAGQHAAPPSRGAPPALPDRLTILIFMAYFWS